MARKMPLKGWVGIATLVIGCVLLWAVTTGGHPGEPEVHEGAPQKAVPAPPTEVQAVARIEPKTVLSGEAVITSDGRFISLPDPTKAEGEKLDSSWQRTLAASMTEAIRNGQEQVVLVFYRHGDSWCYKQKAVLERAMKKRALEMLSASDAATSGTAFLGGGAPPSGMLLAPIRVFILEKSEFPYLTQQFKIQAYPTSMVFGPPGASPLVAQGYMDDEVMARVLKRAAMSERPKRFGLLR